MTFPSFSPNRYFCVPSISEVSIIHRLQYRIVSVSSSQLFSQAFGKIGHLIQAYRPVSDASTDKADLARKGFSPSSLNQAIQFFQRSMISDICSFHHSYLFHLLLHTFQSSKEKAIASHVHQAEAEDNLPGWFFSCSSSGEIGINAFQLKTDNCPGTI